MAISRDALITILAEADPAGLIAAGAPHDEYSAEADAIASLEGIPTLTEITSIFGVHFEDPGICRRETARWIAEQIAARGGIH
ncbi:hypothetical protein [Nigerium massiliense]|uniref:hypothetical protein n=1 Tax=Nigerium massiliense TaxID=1522317 RepID=UPI00058F62D0|nr:hypothetical protein [Nigerium massiliense]